MLAQFDQRICDEGNTDWSSHHLVLNHTVIVLYHVFGGLLVCMGVVYWQETCDGCKRPILSMFEQDDMEYDEDQSHD